MSGMQSQLTFLRQDVNELKETVFRGRRNGFRVIKLDPKDDKSASYVGVEGDE